MGAPGGGSAFGATVAWNLGTLQPGQSGSVTMQVRVNPGLPNGTPITNTAQISSAELQSPVSSNPVTVTIVVAPPPPFLSVVKEEDVASVQPGGTVNYRLTVTNSGGGPATNVTLSDPIPPHPSGKKPDPRRRPAVQRGVCLDRRHLPLRSPRHRSNGSNARRSTLRRSPEFL